MKFLLEARGRFPRKWDAYHIVDNPDSFSYRTCLESHVVHAADQIIDSDVSSGELVEVKLLDFLGAFRHLVRGDEDGICN